MKPLRYVRDRDGKLLKIGDRVKVYKTLYCLDSEVLFESKIVMMQPQADSVLIQKDGVWYGSKWLRLIEEVPHD